MTVSSSRSIGTCRFVLVARRVSHAKFFATLRFVGVFFVALLHCPENVAATGSQRFQFGMRHMQRGESAHKFTTACMYVMLQCADAITDIGCINRNAHQKNNKQKEV